MNFQTATVLALFAAGPAAVFAALAVSSFFQKKIKAEHKLESYECGEIPKEDSLVSFDSRFYRFALAFLIFDVEIVLIYPAAVLYKNAVKDGTGLLLFWEIIIFAGVLFLGLVYLWKKGDLDWNGKNELLKTQEARQKQ